MNNKFYSILFLGIFILFFGSTNIGYSQGNESSIVIEGHYQGKNLYVQNFHITIDFLGPKYIPVRTLRLN